MSNTQLYRSILAARKPSIIGLLNTPAGAGAAAAYSLRMLNADLIGEDIIEVKRVANSDFDRFPLTADGIPFDQIASFCGASDGIIPWWQDQSGNNWAVSNIAEGNTPVIYQGGDFIRENGVPTIEFGVDKWLVNEDVSIDQPNTTIMAGYRSQTASGTSVLFDGSIIRQLRFSTSVNEQASAGSALPISVSIAVMHSSYIFFNGANSLFYINQNLSNSGNTGSNNLRGLVLGKNIEFGASVCRASEFNFFNGDKSDFRTELISNLMDYYGIS